jgi:soluble lytic murein transglycosylase-like protein
MKLLLSVIMSLFCACVANASQADPEAQYYANAYADHYGVPRALQYALIPQESGWNTNAVSSKGACGLMQLMPGTARRYGVRHTFSKPENIGGGTHYLHDLLRQFHDDLRLVVAAYYTGERRVHKRGLHLTDPQVIAYVEQVRRRYVQALRRYPLSSSGDGMNST